MSSRSPRGTVAAAAAFVICCALLPAIVVGAGLASAAVGTALRYWPLTLAGIALAVWAGMRIARAIHRRQVLREYEASDTRLWAGGADSGPVPRVASEDDDKPR